MFPTDSDITRQVMRTHGQSPGTDAPGAAPAAKTGNVGLAPEQRVQASPPVEKAATYKRRSETDGPPTGYPFDARRASGATRGSTPPPAAKVAKLAAKVAEARADKADAEAAVEQSGPAARQVTASTLAKHSTAPPPSVLDHLAARTEAVTQDLAATDRTLRARKRAQAVTGGRYAGSAEFDLAPGPDGRVYAVDGQVPVDVAPVSGDPEATIEKMQVVRRKAVEPAPVDAHDRAVAEQAARNELRARRELEAARAEARKELMEELAAQTIGDPRVEPHLAETVASQRATTSYGGDNATDTEAGAEAEDPGVDTRA